MQCLYVVFSCYLYVFLSELQNATRSASQDTCRVHELECLLHSRKQKSFQGLDSTSVFVGCYHNLGQHRDPSSYRGHFLVSEIRTTSLLLHHLDGFSQILCWMLSNPAGA